MILVGRIVEIKRLLVLVCCYLAENVSNLSAILEIFIESQLGLSTTSIFCLARCVT